MKILSIDPSLRRLGWAFFKKRNLVKYGLLKSPTEKLSKKQRKLMATWLAKIDYMLQGLTDVVNDHGGVPDVVVIEMPRIYRHGSVASQAAKNSGAIEKLIVLVASIRQMMSMQMYKVPRVVLVYPQTWKGQTSKHITRKRMTRRYGSCIEDMDHNIVDAIGIGTWYIEKH